VHITATRPKIVVTADGRGVAARAGSRLLVDLAEATGLSAGFSAAVAGLRERRAGHDPGRVLTDLAVLLADGGEAISDLAVLRNQPEVFGAVASTATAWRVLDGVDCALLSELRSARAAARERAWLARAELGRAGPAVTAGGRAWPGLVLDVDATLVTCHSEKEQAAPTCKGGFGYHPLLVFCDNTGEALAGVLRPGNAGANTAADHITVTDAALAQIPDSHRHGAGDPGPRRRRGLLPGVAGTPAGPARDRRGHRILGRVHDDSRGAGGDSLATGPRVGRRYRGRRVGA
jgi:hypothetical protein